MPKVVVIGAGAAGLTVARELSHVSGYQVTVVEARNRIGGRIHSVELGGVTIDLGASWMHEARVNPLIREAVKHNWPLKFIDEVFRFYTNRGEHPPKAGVVPILGEIESVVAEYFHQSKPLLPEEPSLKDFVTTKVLPEMLLVTDEQKRLAELAYRSVEHFVGLPWGEIGAGDGAGHNALGRDVFMVGSGYQQVVDWLVAGTDMHNVEIKLEEQVTHLSETTHGFVVHTKNNAYDADYVVNTIPLGTLKEISADSGLLGPAAVQGSVKTTRFAALGKVAVQFESVKWDAGTDYFLVAHEDTGDLVSIVNPFADGGHPVLVALTGPDLTQRLEADPENAYEKIEWAFKTVCKDIGDPVKVAVTDWTQSPFSRGSYSARAVGETWDEMVNPFIEGAGRLRFAGEHTTLDGNGCVHGAYETGLREAKAILDMEGSK